MRAWRLAVFVGVAGCILSGCGDSVGTLYPVKGQVTLDGVALNDAQISFVADTTKGNKTQAVTFGKVENGSYSLRTNERPGVPPGWYNATVMTVYPGAPEKPTPIPTTYTDPGRSGLSVEVVANPSPNQYDLKLTSR